MNTHETYVSLETAKLLKEAGFNWEVKTYYHYLSPYDEYNIEFDSISTNYNHLNNADFSAPTLAIVQKWLREVKELIVEITIILTTKKYLVGIVYSDMTILEYDIYYDTYEEALEAGIKKCLTLILEKHEY